MLMQAQFTNASILQVQIELFAQDCPKKEDLNQFGKSSLETVGKYSCAQFSNSVRQSKTDGIGK